MAGRLSVDFGTCNTVVAVWDETLQEGVPLHIPDLGHYYSIAGAEISTVPSLIHYSEDKRRWHGDQVLKQNLYDASPRTFRWMKRYICHRSPAKFQIDGKDISYCDAGSDFLTAVLAFAVNQTNAAEDEVAFTVPVDSYEHYEDWLTGVAEKAGMRRFRLIDEPSAAALGYGVKIQPGDVYLVLDFGGGTLHVAIVLIEEEDQATAGRRCRVLGKAGIDIGGSVIDQWLFEDILRRNGRSDMDEDVRQISRSLLVECERLKERLTFNEKADISVINPTTGAAISASISRDNFEDILDQHDLFASMDSVIRRAMNAARERGYSEESIKSVLMVGGSSMIPSVQRTVQRIFGKDRVNLNRPLDAVARGGAAFVAGVDFFDHIQHDYAIQFVNREKGAYDYRTIVKRGTSYPSVSPIAKMTIKASFDQQKQLGIAIYEMGEQRKRGDENPVELVFDPTGAARVVSVSSEEEQRRTHFWMNEHNPTFLLADPPAKQGEPRFGVEFNLDENKRLVITVKDLPTGRIMNKDYPVVKLV